MTTAEHMQKLEAAVREEGKPVTYKWVARELDVSVNHAKRLLFALANKGGCEAVHVVAGWSGAGAERKRVVRLVSGGADAIEAAKAALDEVTSEHVHSVRASGGDATTDLAVAAHEEAARQTDAMFDAAPDTPNALRDNRHSAVACAQVKRAAGAARRVSAMPKPAVKAEPATKPKPKPAAAAAASAAPASVKSEAKKPAAPFAGFKPVPKPTPGAPASKPTPAAASSKPAAKGGMNAMAAMFAKAPPKKTAAAATPSAAAPAPPPPAPADDDASDEDEEEEQMEIPRHRRGGARRVVDLGSDDDDDDDAPEPEPEPAPKPADPEPEPEKPAKKAKASPKPKAEKKPAAEKPAKKRKSTEPAAAAAAAAAPSPSPPKPKPASNPMDKFVGARANPGVGVAKKKKVVTVMDEETGEEFTKTVWVDEDGNEVPEGGAAATTNADALGEKTNAKTAAAAENPKPKPKPAPGKKPAAAAGGGIASFFAKK